MRKFYIDMDDTLANFRDHAIASGVPPWTGTWYATDPSTWTQEQHDIQARTNEIMEDPNFWLSIPVMPGAFEIISACASRGETYLLTAYPKTCADKAMVKRVKMMWADLKLHFQSSRVIVCDRPEKVQYAQFEMWKNGYLSGGIEMGSNVLIDDATKNCEEWKAAGGIAILSDIHNGVTVDQIVKAIKAL